MSKRFVKKVKLTLVATMMLGSGTLFTSCGLADVKDNLVAGALSAVKGSAATWVDDLIPDDLCQLFGV